VSDNTPLGDRMKRYEQAYRQVLPRRSYTLMRLDGRAFHTYLRGSAKPFDMDFVSEMNMVTQWLCVDIQGAKFAYTQSDEISILITDFDSIQTEPWVGGRIDKLTSLAAGQASAYLSRLRQNHPGLAVFDCRAWPMSDPVEVANYFVWRQRDAVRNSIQMVGQTYFSHQELQGKSCDEIQEMLFSKHGVNFNDIDPGCKRGRLIACDESEGWVTMAAPMFKAEPNTILAQLIPSLPSLND
jgi:tRNA(His) 5'-end guanylyltransferase